MRLNRIKFLFVLVLALLTLALTLPHALHAVTSKDVEGAIMCICKDKCGKVLENCTCGTADIYRKEIREMIAAGKTQKEIVDYYVGRFGEKVLAAPTKTGFNLTAWIVPFLAIFAGGWSIHRLVQSWAKKRSSQPAADKPDEGKSGTEEDKSLYKKTMDKELKEFDE